nr:AbrB family transcriptional regulator [Variibacter gotjawalensis]
MALGFGGGIALGLTGFPAGWMSGAILAVSVAALAGRQVQMPTALTRVTFALTGISMGATVTPETVAGMANWPISLVILAVAVIALTAAVAVYLRMVHGWEPGSALLGAFPGAMATTLILAVQYKADVRAIAIVQTVRVVAIAVLLPTAIAVMGLSGSPVTVATISPLDRPFELAILVVVSVAAAYVTQLLRFPGGLIFGSMTASAILHGTGLIHVSLPRWLTIATFMMLGSLVGTRFAGTSLATLRHLASAAFGALLVSATVAFAAAFLAAWILGRDVGTLVIAYAPGALDAMMILALALNLEPAFVGAHHLARFLLVLLSMPIIVKLMQRLRKSDTPPGDSQ